MSEQVLRPYVDEQIAGFIKWHASGQPDGCPYIKKRIASFIEHESQGRLARRPCGGELIAG